MDTRTHIIDLAERLIRTKGYTGFSYADISKELGIKNAAVHYHFPAKADLGVAMISRTRERFQGTIARAAAKPLAIDKIKLFIKEYRISNKSGWVCFMGALGPAFEGLPPSMQEELTLASQEIRQWISGVLEEGRQNGELNFPGTPIAQADSILTTLLAGLILNKVTREDVLGNSLEQIMKSF